VGTGAIGGLVILFALAGAGVELLHQLAPAAAVIDAMRQSGDLAME
jgi:hypothetical protein